MALTPWQLALMNEQMRVELLMVSERYGLTDRRAC